MQNVYGRESNINPKIMKSLHAIVQISLSAVITGLIAVGVSACQNNENAENIFEPIPANELVTTISDTDASPEQLALKRKIENICINMTTVKDNHLELMVDKDYFIQNNIPVSYYDLIVNEIEAANKSADELRNLGVEINIADDIEEARKRYNAYITEFEKRRIPREEFFATYKD